MKLVHSAATLSHVHSNIWIMTVLLVEGARTSRVLASEPLVMKGLPSTIEHNAPSTITAARLSQFDMGEGALGKSWGVADGDETRCRSGVGRQLLYFV